MDQEKDLLLETYEQILLTLKDRIVNASSVDEAEKALMLLEKVINMFVERERARKIKEQPSGR